MGIRFMEWRGRLQHFGERPLCNLKKERAPHLGRFCLPLCGRCLGLIAGVVLMNAPLVASAVQGIGATARVCCLLVLPVDHVLGRFGISAGSNTRRFMTGVLFAVGVGR